MRIAYINNRASITGIGRYAFTLYEHIKENADVDHFFIDAEDRTLELISNRAMGKNIRNLDYDLLYDNSACRSFFKRIGINHYVTDLRLSNLIGGKYDIFHYTNQFICNSISRSRIKSTGKKVVTVHDLFRDNIFGYIPKNICFHGLNLVDAIICVSDYTKKQVLDSNFNISEDDIKVIHQGVSPSFRPYPKIARGILLDKYKIPKDAIILLHVGKPFRRKNDIQLVKILNYIVSHQKYNNIVLIKVGLFSGDASAYIQKYHLSNNIINIQGVSESDLIELYNLADIFVFPSISEGFGFPVLEAMACGTPVVASNTTSIPEIVGDAGILIEPYNTEGFSESIIELSTNENLITHYSKAGLQRATKFSWSKTAKMTYDLYQEILSLD